MEGADPIRPDDDLACAVIKFLYEGQQEIGEPVNIQSNQYQQAPLQSSNFLKSCWLFVPTFINNIRGEIHQISSSSLKNMHCSPFAHTAAL